MQRFSRTALAIHSATAAIGAGGVSAIVLMSPTAPDWIAAVATLGGAGYVWLRMRRWIARVRGPSDPSPAIIEVLESLPYYRRLSDAEQARFRTEVCWFLAERAISGVGIELDDELRALIASSAVTLSFGLEGYEWDTLREVLVYPDAFDDDFNVHEDGELLGQFHEQGPLIFSARELRASWEGEDGFNVGLHEFAHLMDFDGDAEVDGTPSHLADGRTAARWTQLVAAHLRDMHRNPRLLRLLDDYAYTDEAEFFACITEAFFEVPDALEPVAPELYGLLRTLYRQDPLARLADEEREPLEVDDDPESPARALVASSFSRT